MRTDKPHLLWAKWKLLSILAVLLLRQRYYSDQMCFDRPFTRRWHMTSGHIHLNNGSQSRTYCQTFPIFTLCLLDCLTAWMINWSFDVQCSAHKFYSILLDVDFLQHQQENGFVNRQTFICHISVMWFIDVNGMQMKLLNDLVTYLFWFTVHHLRCNSREKAFSLAQKMNWAVFFRKLISGEIQWMLFLSSNQFVQQCMDNTSSYACVS